MCASFDPSMRSTYLLFIFYFICQFKIQGQNTITGTYRTYFGNRLNIMADSTFEYRWNFDMQSNWTHGQWLINKDTILFHIISVYDTLKITDKKGKKQAIP